MLRSHAHCEERGVHESEQPNSSASHWRVCSPFVGSGIPAPVCKMNSAHVRQISESVGPMSSTLLPYNRLMLRPCCFNSCLYDPSSPTFVMMKRPLFTVASNGFQVRLAHLLRQTVSRIT